MRNNCKLSLPGQIWLDLASKAKNCKLRLETIRKNCKLSLPAQIWPDLASKAKNCNSDWKP